MTIEDDNVAILKSAYKEWDESKGGSRRLFDLLDDQVELKSLAAGADGVEFTKRRNGKAEYLHYIDALTEHWRMNFYRVDHYIAQGDRVVAVGVTSWTNKATGKEVKTPKADVWQMRNGKAIAFWEFYDTAALIAATQKS
jgi:ketosteroid isomerase-like protein